MGSQTNTSIGGFLAALGMTRTVYKSSLEREGTERKTVTAAWNPNAAFDPTDPASFESRYGFASGPSGPSAGSLTGERVSDDLLLAVARDPSNPFDLVNNTSYTLRPGDHQDVQYGTLDGTTAVWDSVVMPAILRLFPQEGPVAPNAPSNARPTTSGGQTTAPPPPPPATPRDPVLVPAVSPQVPNPFTHPFLGRVPYSRMVKAFGGHVAWPFEAYVRQHRGEEEVLAAWLHKLDQEPENPVFKQLQKEFGG